MNKENDDVLQEELCIHFDTDEHQIPLDVFLTTGMTVGKISKEFNKKFFDNKITPEIYVIPPKNGGFMEILNLIVSTHPIEVGISGWFLNFLLKRYTDKSIKEWADKVGCAAFDEIEKEIKRVLEAKDNMLMDAKIALKLYMYSLSSFILTDTETLRKWDITPMEFRDSFEAKNNFYESCLQPNTGIKGIGCSRKHCFAVKRSEFSKHITKLPSTEDDVYYKLQKVIITNPTIVDDNTPWTGRLASNNKKITFHMKDDNFKDKLIKGLCPIKSSNLDDEMIVYFEYRTLYGKNLKPRQVISANIVYSFNQKQLLPIPEGLKIEIPQKNENPTQMNLI